jgi:hypothetical protein
VTRLYLPTTLERLRTGWADGALEPGPDVVVAEGDDEDSEYAALMTAADASTALLAGAGRRVVVVAEVAGPEAAGRPVPLKRVVAVHADTAERPADADPDDDLAWYATQEVPDLLS